MYEKTKILAAFFIVIFLAGSTRAAVADNSLQISLIKYDPYPVNPDSDFSIWVQVKNVGENDVSGASIELIQKYPFSIKNESAVKYPGTIRKNDEIVYTFTVHVDKDAYVGTNTIEIGYRLDGFFTKKEFDIEVGSDVVNAKGTVRLEKFTLQPEVLMVGDTATVTITLKNSASEYAIKMDGKDYSMNAHIQSAELLGNEFVDITSEPYYNAGIVGPGDSLDLSYTVRVKNNTPDATYFLDFNLKGSARLYSLNLKIPIRVDNSSIQTTLSETPEFNPGKIVLSVANNRLNTVQAASIIPMGNASFEPTEYFIGTMEPDELFTVKFDMKPDNPQENIKFRLRFKNGNNWHESEPMNVKLNGSTTVQTRSTEKLSFSPPIAILAAVLIIIAGFFAYKRYRRVKSR